MSLYENWIILLVLILVIPLFFWYRVKAMNTRKNLVHVRCPHCRKDQHILHMRNYTCQKCGEFIRFYDDEGTVLITAKTYECEACGSRNFVGVMSCTECGHGNQKGNPEFWK